MNFLTMIVVGFLAGTAAKYLMPGDEGGGFLLTTLLGIGGGVVGGWLFSLIGLSINSLLGDIIGATAGALVLIFVYNKIKGKKT